MYFFQCIVRNCQLVSDVENSPCSQLIGKRATKRLHTSRLWKASWMGRDTGWRSQAMSFLQIERQGNSPLLIPCRKQCESDCVGVSNPFAQVRAEICNVKAVCLELADLQSMSASVWCSTLCRLCTPWWPGSSSGGNEWHGRKLCQALVQAWAIWSVPLERLSCADKFSNKQEIPCVMCVPKQKNVRI